jgi:hypothetical protein
VVLIACVPAQARSYRQIAAQQKREKNAVRNAITEGYPRLNDLPNSKHGYSVGLANVVMEAVRMGVFYEGQTFKDAAGVFGQDESLRKEWMCLEGDGRFVVLIPLETHDWQIKVPHTVGVQWHLALVVGKDTTVKEIGMKYCSPKTLLLKRIKTDLFTESELARSIAKQDSGGKGE